MIQAGKVEDLAQMSKALTSGRFDPIHPGHILNILRISENFDKLTVVVLDHPERRFPVCYSIRLFSEIFKIIGRKINFVTNVNHFGEITEEQIKEFDFGVYAGGNMDVLKHIHQLGYETIYFDREFQYNASDIPLPK